MTLPSVTGLDHFIILIHDIDRAQRLFERLGFRLTERGFHSGRGSANHTVPLNGGNYFELLFIPAEGRTNGRFAALSADFEGPVAAMLQTHDSSKVHDELAALGFDLPDPWALERPVKLPDGNVSARFLNQVFPDFPPPISFGTCQHLTRDFVWRPEWQDHPNTAQNITRLILVHKEPASLAPFYKKVFGSPSVSVGENGLVLRLGKALIEVFTPQAFGHRYPSIDLPAGLPDGWFAGATIEVADVATAAAILNRAKIPFAKADNGNLVIEPLHAANTLIEFTAQS